ncbi:uracil-DNA glycosylase [Alginatibacterium sediminis]|uniref:Uracil-DNA glycosylase n=1 Tax=Alginatibacterium sediminis TaxID=2164068 RepID=A0A420E6V2_9ALTE|nr:uracil-DNA glycosylase [Alginatibacterium sediminis]RKF13215.1 uracil-DNA glycosylase [Alginatibacterium sediminis]
MNWDTFLSTEQRQDYYRVLQRRLASEMSAGRIIYPPESERFAAFEHTPLGATKVVIIGQDPYHGENQAHGLSFSVKPGQKIPPSLRNIYKELANEYADWQQPQHGNLECWAKQGVLLLNSVLSVEQAKPNAHAKWGWEQFTDAAIATIDQHCEGVIFLLWGSHAQKKGLNINNQRHHVLSAPHPSPLSAHRGFFGCDHFIAANALLTQQGRTPINWQV